MVKDLVEHLKAENKQNEGHQEATAGMMSNMKMPNIKMPNMKMPKL